MPLFDSSVLFAGLGLLVVQAVFAWADGMLTPAQMKRGGVPQGLPFVAHGGMWGDVILTFWLAYLAGKYGAEWEGENLFILSIVLGGLITVVMNETYKKSDVPEAHMREHSITAAGFAHSLFMAGAIAIIALFFLGTAAPAPSDVWTTCVLLAVHVVIANHFVLGLFAPSWYPGRPLSNPAGWATIIASATALGVLGWWKLL